MGSLKLTTASSGSVILSPANTASDVTITVPAVTGTMITTASTFAGTGPAFSAYSGASQTISNSTFTKLQINTKEFDTNTNFDATTNYRFTPTVSGYYQVNGSYYPAGAASGYNNCAVYKNGAIFKTGNSCPNNAVTLGSTVSCLVFLNGSTDYIELYALQNSGGNLGTSSTAPYTYFQASMVRAA